MHAQVDEAPARLVVCAALALLSTPHCILDSLEKLKNSNNSLIPSWSNQSSDEAMGFCTFSKLPESF